MTLLVRFSKNILDDHRTSWLDALSTLSAVTTVTNRIKLATSVLNIVVRRAIICANSLATIDILSVPYILKVNFQTNKQGDKLNIYGKFVFDTDRRWNEIHPATTTVIR
ncbi:MAG TPA: LLM class flavin-dependent oxidoreductase [Nitrososphaeraceae archaeon]|nr:LLM class flavin-dependent oxidoreductase [Nitrososphaeraceae archaeon]